MPDPVSQPPDSFRPGEPPHVPPPEQLNEQIVLRPTPKPVGAKSSLSPAAIDKNQPPVLKDGFREVIETIVFVVVLVLLLKTFLAEAFVIPTGSMATTLLGYHKDLICDECGIAFPVNCSQEVEPQVGKGFTVTGGVCPNCQKVNELAPRLNRR